MCTCCLSLTGAWVISCWERCFAPADVDLESVLPSLKTGDIVLCRSDALGSGIFSCGTSPWDHVGMVYVPASGGAYILDSGSLRYAGAFCPLMFDPASRDDAEWLQLKSGPQMYSISDLFASLAAPDMTQPFRYTRVAFRRLRKPLTREQHSTLDAAIVEMRDRPYERNKGQLFNSAVDVGPCCFANTREDMSSLFCSELQAALFMRIGLLGPSPVSSEYAPSDFSRDNGCNASSFLGCCCFSWVLGRCFGVSDLKSAATRRPLFGPEIPVRVAALAPQASAASHMRGTSSSRVLPA